MNYRDTVTPNPARSWLAHMSAGLGTLALMGVLCFHFPELLTSRDFRQAYSEEFARHLLLLGVIVAFIFGTIAILRNRNRRIALFGVVAAALAVVLGGSSVHFNPIKATAFSLGLDWFVISLFFSTIIFVPLERMFYVRNLSTLRPGWRDDLSYYFFSHLLVQFILIAVTTSTGAMDKLIASTTLKNWIQDLPVLVQFFAAVFFADLAQAVLHRIYHQVPFLWRFHAVHHSSRHMDWLAGSRVHLVEVILTRSAVLLPLVLLGFSSQAVNGYIILVGIQAVLAHANFNFNFGWLEYVLVTPRYHHWHHARHKDYMFVNYAIHLPLIDMLMGTFKLPPAKQWPKEYGVMKLETVPQGLLAQTLMPFSAKKIFDDYVGNAD